MNLTRRTIARWGIFGFLFGGLFPAIGWVVAMRGTDVGVSGAHSEQPVLWIVDLAPFVLALAAMWIGSEHAKLSAALADTDRRVRERTAELRDSNQRLERLISSKDQFLATVSHELRTPLTVVSGFAQELVDEQSDVSGSEALELLAIIAEQSRELGFIIEDLLVAARADVGVVAISKEETDVVDELRMVIAGCVCSKEERASFKLDLDSAVADLDPTRLRQILRNLMTNAIRYGGSSRRVETRSTNGAVIVRVCDNGPGIPEENRERMFEPYQSSGAAEGVRDSVGLGLTVSRKLARLMGGDLTYSYVNQNSIFELTFPSVVARSSDLFANSSTH